VLANLTIGHIVVELEIAVKLGLHVDGAEGELVDSRSASERRGSLLVRSALSTDCLSAATVVEATIASDVAAGETLPGEVIVLDEVTQVEVLEREPGLLLVRALVVGVLRAVERGEAAEALKLC